MKYSDKILMKAQSVHEKIMCLDTHVDINVSNFTDQKNYANDIGTQVNLPNMEKGDLDAVFFIVYTEQGELTDKGYQKAYKNAMDKFDSIHKLTKEIAPDKISLAVTSQQAKEIFNSGKKVALIGVENAYPLGTDISRVKQFYDLGARYMSLSHNGHNQCCDSNTGENHNEWLHNGLSDFGKEIIREMNSLGMMIDVSHLSKKSMQDIIELSKAPIIASHSSARTLCNHPRNLDDEQLIWMKENGGVVQVVAFSAYLKEKKHHVFEELLVETIKSLAKEEGFEVLSKEEVRRLSDQKRAIYNIEYRRLSKEAILKIDVLKNPPVDVSDFVDHIEYLVKKVGIEHVGVSSDFDGGGGIYGWSDASETLNVTAELIKRGYTEIQIEQLWSGNLLRVLDEVQTISKKM